MLDDLVMMGARLAPDESQGDTREGLASLRAFDRAVMGAGLDDSARVHTRAAGMELVAEYAVPLAKMAAAPVAGAIVAWLHGRAGRRVKFKVGDVLIEARAREDVEALVAKVNEVRSFKPAPRKSGPSSKLAKR